MDDTKLIQKLTATDKISVYLYRGGIVLATLCMIYGVYFFINKIVALNDIKNGFTSFLSKDTIPKLIFWIFFTSIGISIFTLHLYSKQVLKVIRSFYIISVIIFIVLAFTKYPGQLNVFITYLFNDWTGTIGLGFLLAAFSGIGAKEAFCFKLYEGYLFGILNLILILIHLIGVVANVSKSLFLTEVILFTIITLLVIIFTIRKLRLPLYYDIGDKSRYKNNYTQT